MRSGILTLAFLALAGIGCYIAGAKFDREQGPESKVLLERMMKRIGPQASAGVSFELRLSGELKGDLGELPKGLAGGSEAVISGYLDQANLSLKGSGAAAGFELLIAGTEVYLLERPGQWIRAQLPFQPVALIGAEPIKAAQLASLFTAPSFGGPLVGGAETWELSGASSAEAEAPASVLINLSTIREDISYTLALGREDSLPRLFSFGLSGKAANWFPGLTGSGVTEATMQAELEFSAWGKPPPGQASELRENDRRRFNVAARSRNRDPPASARGQCRAEQRWFRCSARRPFAGARADSGQLKAGSQVHS